MREHAIVTICVMLSFCLRANFLPEISGGARGGARRDRLPLILRPNRGPKGRKKFTQTPRPPLISGSVRPGPPPLIWRAGSDTGNNNSVQLFENRDYIYSLSSVVWEMSPRSSPEQTLALLGKAQESGWNGADKMMRPFFSTPVPQAMSYICD